MRHARFLGLLHKFRIMGRRRDLARIRWQDGLQNAFTAQLPACAAQRRGGGDEIQAERGLMTL
jgi:hypothetical protein